MTKYREIIRLKSLNFSERNIALSCSVSRNTVSKICKKADELNLVWPLDESMTDAALEKLLFPRDKSATNKRMPDYTYIRKELLRNGVSKKLLLMILTTPGQHSCNTRTTVPTTPGQAFLKHADIHS